MKAPIRSHQEATVNWGIVGRVGSLLLLALSVSNCTELGWADEGLPRQDARGSAAMNSA